MKEEFPISRIVKRDGSVVAYDRTRISNAILKALASVGQPDMKLAETMAGKVEAAILATYGPAAMPSVEDIQDLVESVLMENGLTKVARNYIIYRHQHAMARAARAHEFEVSDNVPYKKLYEVLRWNIEHGCDSIENLNKIIRSGGYAELVAAANKRFDEEVDCAARLMLQRRGSVRIAIIAGPSSSGKTTTTIKLSERLGRSGVKLKAINLDNYFFDIEKHPVDEFGDRDYETPEALDMPLINEHLKLLLEGKTIRTPRYEFKTGRRRLNAQEMRLEDDEVLLIDSLHGLYDAMTAGVPAEAKFRLYIETLGQMRAADGTFMRWADNRLLRRMARDKDHRNLKPLETLTHWHYVRKSEIKHIIPYIKRADMIINSALPYELPLFKRRLFRYFSDAVKRYRDDPKRLDAYIRAYRVHRLLQPLRLVRDESCIPPDSLVREFIGGSCYRY